MSAKTHTYGTKITVSDLRSHLREKYGKGMYRIASDDTCSAYGAMPNSTATGWYFIGWLDELLSELQDERDAEAACEEAKQYV